MPRRTPDGDLIVYSTDQRSQTGRVAARPATTAAPRGDGIVRVRRETGGRGGKTVTTIAGIGGGADRLREVAGELKRLCGTGGTVKDGVIEIQGDHRERIVDALRAQGHVVKLAGG